VNFILLLFADLPDGDPAVFAEKQKYSLGEKIRANCTSRASYPAANLTWFVNGQQVLIAYRQSPIVLRIAGLSFDILTNS
jgi:hypothetical protein